MWDKGVESKLIAMWNDGASSGVIARELLMPIERVHQTIVRLRRRGVPLRTGAPNRRHRVANDFKDGRFA